MRKGIFHQDKQVNGQRQVHRCDQEKKLGALLKVSFKHFGGTLEPCTPLLLSTEPQDKATDVVWTWGAALPGPPEGSHHLL